MARTIKPDEFSAIASDAVVLDVRRGDDYAASADILPGAAWHDPAKIDDWIAGVPKDRDVVIYCVRGGSVSNSVLDRLLAEGIKARYIEGGIEGLKAAGGVVTTK